MTKPIPDKAEVALEYADKLYIGTFAQTARFDAHFDKAGISLSLYREGGSDTRKSVRMHFHYALFAETARFGAHGSIRSSGRRRALRGAGGRRQGSFLCARERGRNGQRQERRHPIDARRGSFTSACNGMNTC